MSDLHELHPNPGRAPRVAVSIVAALIIATSSGCAPRGAHPELMAARLDYARAQSDPAVRQAAAVPLHEADRILRGAEEVWEDGGKSSEVGHLASLARSQIQVAYSMAAYDKARLELESRREADARAQQLAVDQELRRAAAEPTLHSPEAWRAPVDVRVHTSHDGTVGGTLINKSPHPIADVLVMVNHEWLWSNEFKPGTESPGRTEYFRVTEPIPPGGSVNFTHRPTVPLPYRNDGRFETSLEVVAFDEIR